MTINITELKLWLIQGIGPSTFNKVKNFFKENIDDIFIVDTNTLKKINIPDKIIEILQNKNEIDNLIEQEMNYCIRNNITIIEFNSEEYPNLLRNITNPPPFLFAKGDVSKLNNKSIAIVGTRNPTSYGEKITKHLTSDLTNNGLTIVSGLARGIDSIAHTEALKDGETIAVLGNGFQHIYPLENKKLYDEIIEKNIIITEFPFCVPPEKFNFPMRNRIISGLSLGVLVIEAKEKSGSLITASLALEQGKEVFAIPGEINNPYAIGPNKLIKDGAKMVLEVDDILEEFNFPIKKSTLEKNKQINTSTLNHLELSVFELIKTKKVIQLEEINENLNLNISSVIPILSKLNINGFIKEMPGKFYCIDD